MGACSGARSRDVRLTPDRPSGKLRALHAAFDEARFGPARTLNLRNTLPTVRDAVARTESWLRERQASRSGELLVITGRGNQSEGGISPVREAVVHLFASLRRRGVIARTAEHTPGSFVVTPAPLRAAGAIPMTRRRPTPPRCAPSIRRRGSRCGASRSARSNPWARRIRRPSSSGRCSNSSRSWRPACPMAPIARRDSAPCSTHCSWTTMTVDLPHAHSVLTLCPLCE